MKQLTLLLVLAISFSTYAQKDTQEINQFITELDQKIPQLLNDFMVPGTAIAIIENGKVVLKKGYGVSDIAQNTAVTTQTGFNIGSISKTIAAWSILKLVEEGRLDLDAPAEKYLTRWHLPESNFDSNKVTIRRLLSHTAGLSLHGYPGWTPKDQLPTVEESLNGKNNGPGRVEMIMEPGTQWKYSGGGYTILQLIVEEVTGQKFEAYAQTAVLNPLGMTQSSYTIDAAIMKNSSKEYNNFGEEIDFELFTAQAAAGLHTTLDDFILFAQASLFNSGNPNKVLSKKTVATMLESAPASNGSYGLGYQIETIPGTSMTLMGHGGANSGWHAIFRVNPVTNDGFIMVTNGGAGHNIYRQIYCDWVFWKTGTSLGNRCKALPPVAIKIKQEIEANGLGALKQTYMQLKQTSPDAYDFSGDQLNSLGYHYLANKSMEEALAVFQLNIEAYPESANAYDSYGEALLENGDKELAIKNYKKSVELNPGNDGGIAILKKLGVDVTALSTVIVVDEKILQKYVGKYELEPGFILTVTKNGNRMMGEATGQGSFEIFPKSDTEFYLKVTEAQLVFNSNEKGAVESVTLLRGGRSTTGLKLKE